MRLRRRLGLAVAVTTCATVVLAFAITWLVFRRGQERGLDDALLVRARFEAKAAQRLGAAALAPLSPSDSDQDEDIDHLITFGALYRPDGTLAASTPSFRDQAPPLSRLGWHPGAPLPHSGFDFRGPDVTLRGVLVRVGVHPEAGGLLLLAAPREDLETDTRRLVEVMGAVLAGTAALAILLGGWIGGRIARGVEAIAAVARDVARGELASRVPSSVGRESEIRALAADLNRMIDRLQSVINAQRRFISHAAHELRSPLAALRGELELALRHPRSADAYRGAIGGALDDTNRLVALAEDLLALARLDGGAVERIARSSVAAIVREAVGLARPHGAPVPLVDVAVDDLEIEGRGGELVRLVRNLVDNALAHAPEGKAVRIRSRVVLDVVELLVEDDGPGVPPDARDRVFEPFYRGDDQRGRSGAGLGLAIAREIARAHGGDLRVDEGAPATRFVVTLPVARPATPRT